MTYLEDICIKLEAMDSSMSDDQFMVHVLNTLTKDYDTIVHIIGRQIKSSKDTLDIEELREELSLRYDRINR
jgi:gag-polypeptide of LTR copia-type